MRSLSTGRAGALAVLLLVALVGSGARAELPVTTYKLDNGLDVVVIEDHRAPVVTQMVWYRVGAADEQRGKSGIAHFFEHLMFKATDDLAAGDFSRIVAENGGNDNAFTAQDYTSYFQKIAADRLDLVMRMEADRMRDLILTPDVVETERSVILEERNSRTDNDPSSLFSEQMQAALYLNQAYSVPIIGWRHEIEALDIDDATEFYRRYYAPDNAILVVAGDVSPEDVWRKAVTHFGPLAPSGNPPDVRAIEPPQLAARRIAMEDPRVGQPYVIRNYLVPSRVSSDDATAAALTVLSRVLGDGITSRFTEALELDQKIAVSTGAYYQASAKNMTAFGIFGVPAPGGDLATVEAALDAVLDDVIANGPTEEELDRIKRVSRASTIFGLDSVGGQARRYGAGLAVGLDIARIQGWPDAIQAVTPADVQRVAQDYLRPERSVTGTLTRTDGGEG